MPIITYRAVINTELRGVKSRLVWNVNKSRPQTTAPVSTAACITMMPFMVESTVATATDSATVNAANNCMLSGDLWRLPRRANNRPSATKQLKSDSCGLHWCRLHCTRINGCDSEPPSGNTPSQHHQKTIGVSLPCVLSVIT